MSHDAPAPGSTMTSRARAYLALTVVGHAAIGSSAIVLADRFTGPAYSVARAIMPIPVWGLLFLIGSAFLLHAAISRSEDRARVGMVVSVVLEAVLATAFACSFAEGGATTPVGTIAFLVLMGKDLLMCGQPLVTPFERLAEEYDHPKGR
ncbi:hypothetical protein GCM10023340_38960 [Nocardioides marinquilinus]|uniref:Uncharacterized protein n=1 Tax=Nocardioides marinquilinus TaxID=1210400 RepID=A0ABP9PZV0_9ACTN